MVIVGLLAAVLTTGSWIPQLVRVWRTRSTDDLSWSYLGTFASGVFLWLVYGLYREDPADRPGERVHVRRRARHHRAEAARSAHRGLMSGPPQITFRTQRPTRRCHCL